MSSNDSSSKDLKSQSGERIPPVGQSGSQVEPVEFDYTELMSCAYKETERGDLKELVDKFCAGSAADLQKLRDDEMQMKSFIAFAISKANAIDMMFTYPMLLAKDAVSGDVATIYKAPLFYTGKSDVEFDYNHPQTSLSKYVAPEEWKALQSILDDADKWSESSRDYRKLQSKWGTFFRKIHKWSDMAPFYANHGSTQVGKASELLNKQREDLRLVRLLLQDMRERTENHSGCDDSLEKYTNFENARRAAVQNPSRKDPFTKLGRDAYYFFKEDSWQDGTTDRPTSTNREDYLNKRNLTVGAYKDIAKLAWRSIFPSSKKTEGDE